LGLGAVGANPNVGTKGVLNINGGTAYINTITNGGSATSAISINGGVLVVSNSICTPAAAVPTFALTNAALHLQVNGVSIATNVLVTNLTANGMNVISLDSIQNVTNQTTLPLICY